MSQQVFSKGEIIADRFLVLEHRRGGLSEVYLTFDLNPVEHNCRALKTLRLTDGWWSSEQRVMLRQEAAAWVSLGAHPNIVRCFVTHDVSEVPYLVLEWVSDEESNTRSLRDVMRHSLIDRRAALRGAADLCRALLHCRDRLGGFAHGDIKPENVLIGERSSFKLTDFGLARTAFSLRSRGGATENPVWGTPHYMAPELWSGRTPDERSDVYAVGCLMYEMLEGELPFPGRTLTSVRRAHLEVDPPPPSLMTGPVWEVVRRCLAKDPGARPAGYEELADMVGALTGRARAGGTPAAPPQRELRATDYGNQALTLLQTGNYDEALQAFEKALALDPNLSRAYNNRALLYHKLGRNEEALRDWARAVEIDPEFVEALSNRAGLYLELEQLDLALHDARRTVELNDRWPTGLVNLAAVLHKLGRNEEALEYVNRALRLAPDDASGLLARGQIQMALEQFAEGLVSFTRVLSLKGLTPASALKAQVKRMQCLMRTDREDAAYAEIDSLPPGDAAFLGDILLRIDEPMLAMRALRRADGEDEGVKELLQKTGRRLVEMSLADDPRVMKYNGYRYWCDDPEQMVKDLAEGLQGEVTIAELRRMLDILGGAVPSTEAEAYPLLRDPAFREVFERVVFPLVPASRRHLFHLRFLMLERGA